MAEQSDGPVMNANNVGQRGDRLPILALDFDGVVHDYKHGWRQGEIYGHVTEGFFAWAKQAAQRFTLVIHSSRARDVAGLLAIAEWLGKEAEFNQMAGAERLFSVQAEKPPALITIDDRCVCFQGDWSDPALEPSRLRAFRPWMMAENAELAKPRDG